MTNPKFLSYFTFEDDDKRFKLPVTHLFLNTPKNIKECGPKHDSVRSLGRILFKLLRY